MTGDMGSNHWSSDKVWNRKRRKQPNRTTPYIISLRLSDDEINAMDDIRQYLEAFDDSTEWSNNSMLLRRIIRFGKAYIELLKIQKEEKNQNQKQGVV